MISGYTPKSSLDDCQKDDFYDSLINIVRKIRERETAAIAGEFDGQVESNPENYKEQQGGYGVRNREGERILEF